MKKSPLKLKICGFNLIEIKTVSELLRTPSVEFIKSLINFNKRVHKTNNKIVQTDKCRLAVNCYGSLNLKYPDLNSDLFFFQQSDLSGDDILTLHSMPQEPVDANMKTELDSYGIEPIILGHNIAKTSNVELFIMPQWKKRIMSSLSLFPKSFCSVDERWLHAEIKVYEANKSYWHTLFNKYNIKTYVSWHKYTNDHCVIADALNELNGVFAMYQRSFEGNPSAATTVSTDIMFGFSEMGYQAEKMSESSIDYYIITGYMGDHRFKLVNEQANKIREKLKNNGARYVAAFFDEGAMPDGRWWNGHEVPQEHYSFLLEKLLNEPEFGLILKPKTPHKLKRRLGSVYELLSRALETGRCHLYEDGKIQGTVTPSQAALSADLAIHSSIAASTAGIEASLAGVATVFLDFDGFKISPLYGLGVNKVIFHSWEDLWHVWKEKREDVDSLPGFADLSPMYDKLDPFRDGRAAERMGNYLKWIIDGYNSNLSKETILADAAERYCKQWGQNKVLNVNNGQ